MTKPPKKPAKKRPETTVPEKSTDRIMLAVCLARILNRQMRARGWTQLELATQIRASRTAVAGWLKERRGSGVDSIALDRIAQGLYPAEHPALAFATLCQKLATESQDVYLESRLIAQSQNIGVPGTKGEVNPAAAGVSGLRGARPAPPILPPPPPPRKPGRPRGVRRSSNPTQPRDDDQD